MLVKARFENANLSNRLYEYANKVYNLAIKEL